MDSLNAPLPVWAISATLLLISIVIAFAVISFVRGQPPLDHEKARVSTPHTSRLSVSGSGRGGRQTQSDADAHPNGRVDVYFGSQTGTAEGFAKQLAKHLKKYGFDGKVLDLDDFDPDRLQSTNMAVFVVATYGEGDPTDNAMDFHKWLKDDDEMLTNQSLGGLKYAVFGLGSTQYEHYNRMGKFADKRLGELGAERILALGLGDDASGTLEEEFERWREELIPSLQAAASQLGRELVVSSSSLIDGDVEGGADALTVPQLEFTLTYLKTPSSSSAVNKQQQQHEKVEDTRIHASTRFYFEGHHASVRLSENRELRSPCKDGASTRHIELDLSGTSLTYNTADNLAVLPENTTESVESLAHALHYDLSATIDITPLEGYKHPFPTPCTVRDCLTRYVDIRGIPRRALLAQLAVFAKDPEERKRLCHLASKKGVDGYNDIIVRNGRSLLDVCTHLFPSLSIPLDHLLNLTPHLQPRYYTISSSSSLHPSQIHLTVSVTHTPLTDGRTHTGVCSGYLASLPKDTHIRVFVRPSSFRLPEHPRTPLILVGPGTGIAPMRALLQERRYRRTLKSSACAASVRDTVEQPQAAVEVLLSREGGTRKGRSSTPAVSGSGACAGLARDKTGSPPPPQSQSHTHIPSMEQPSSSSPPPLQTRQHTESSGADGGSSEVEGEGEAHLFFGCRRRDTDFLYADELQSFVDDHTLTQLHTAFSREGAVKVYVQHLLGEEGGSVGERVWGLVCDGKAHVYVCGATMMGHDVHDAFVALAMKHGRMSQEGAQAYVQRLQSEHRYVQELWSA